MSNNAGPRPGDTYLKFDGADDYVEIPSIDDYSASTTGELTVAAWMRPDVLNFPHWEGTRYVHWLGKGEGSGGTGQQEWVFRIYNRDHTEETPPRPNRISFYLFNPEGGVGVGSYFQDKIKKGQWVHVVAVVDATRTYICKGGVYRRCDTYRGPSAGRCPIHFVPGSDVQLVINPQGGPSPLRLGTRDLQSFLKGGLTRFRIWNRALGVDEVSALYASDTVPQGGLVAEFLLTGNTGAIATDSAQGNDGAIFGASWATQD